MNQPNNQTRQQWQELGRASTGRFETEEIGMVHEINRMTEAEMFLNRTGGLTDKYRIEEANGASVSYWTNKRTACGDVGVTDRVWMFLDSSKVHMTDHQLFGTTWRFTPCDPVAPAKKRTTAELCLECSDSSRNRFGFADDKAFSKTTHFNQQTYGKVTGMTAYQSTWNFYDGSVVECHSADGAPDKWEAHNGKPVVPATPATACIAQQIMGLMHRMREVPADIRSGNDRYTTKSGDKYWRFPDGSKLHRSPRGEWKMMEPDRVEEPKRIPIGVCVGKSEDGSVVVETGGHVVSTVGIDFGIEPGTVYSWADVAFTMNGLVFTANPIPPQLCQAERACNSCHWQITRGGMRRMGADTTIPAREGAAIRYRFGDGSSVFFNERTGATAVYDTKGNQVAR